MLFNDYGNLFLEKFLFAAHPSVLLDFDDDMMVAKKEPIHFSFFGKLLMGHPRKWSASLKYYTGFIPGTGYLGELLKSVHPVPDSKICIIPTCVDYEDKPVHDYSRMQQEVIIGWAGSAHNLRYIDEIIGALNNVYDSTPFRLLVISNKNYTAEEANFPIDNISWSKEHEIENLNRIDIGIMPLADTLEERGKCGFKLIQYMGCGIVSIASAITFNNEIVDDGVNSYLVYEPRSWEVVLDTVLHKKGSFSAVGEKAREKVLSRFSFKANEDRYIQFIRRSYGLSV